MIRSTVTLSRRQLLGTVAAVAVPRRADPPEVFLRYFGRRQLRGSISPQAVDSIASAIQTQEGFYPGSLAYQNNNPGNLIYVGQAGASPGAGGFAKFPTYAAGRSALTDQITLDAVRGTDASGNPTTTVSQLINSWAPASDPRNDPASYIASVATQTGFDPNASLSSLGLSDSSFVADVGLPVSSGSDGFSFSDLPGVDLSGLGLGSISPAWLVGGALLALLVVSNR